MKPSRTFTIVLSVALVGGVVLFMGLDPDAGAHLFNGLLMLALPLALAVALSRRLKASWSLFGIGALTFIASQVLHLPFNFWVLNPLIHRWGLDVSPTSQDYLLIGLLGGLSAGFFEETARLVAFRRFLPDTKKWRDGLMFGAGHGGIEAIILGVLALYVFLKALVLRDVPAENLASMVGADQLQATQAFIQAYWGASWYDSLLGAVERLSAIAVHLCLSVMVLQVNRRGQMRWYWLAVFSHMLVDMIAVYGVNVWGAYVMEGVVMLLALAGIGIIFWLRDEDRPGVVISTASEAIQPPSPLEKLEITGERLENSRYED